MFGNVACCLMDPQNCSRIDAIMLMMSSIVLWIIMCCLHKATPPSRPPKSH